VTQCSALLSLALRKSPGQSVLSVPLSNSSVMAREECEVMVLRLPSHCDVWDEHCSGEVFLPPSLLFSSLLQKLAASCLFPPVFNLGVGLRDETS